MKTKVIYLADDDEDDRMFLREAIENDISDVCLVEASNGKQLINFLSDPSIVPGLDLIILDISMPIMNGLETLIWLKANEHLKYIPVVILSTSNDPSQVNDAYAAGASAYLVKPVSMDGYSHITEVINACFVSRFPYSDRLTTDPVAIKSSSILIVEDNPFHANFIRNALIETYPDINVISLKDCETTLTFLNLQWNSIQPSPKMIIVDLYLPSRHDGLILVDSIRNFFKSNNLLLVPVIVFSNSSLRDDIKASFDHSVNSYMVKPLELEKLTAYFKALVHYWLNIIKLPR